MTKDFGSFFIILSSVTSLKDQFTRVHKLFLPLLYFLQENFLRTYKVVENTFFWEKKATFQVNKNCLTNSVRIIEHKKRKEHL